MRGPKYDKSNKSYLFLKKLDKNLKLNNLDIF